jgi:uncharacterized delta-60 repeat protein
VRRLGLAIVVLACAAPSAGAAPGAPGTLDHSFGVRGVAVMSDPFLEFTPSFLARQRGGGFLLGARASVPSSPAGPGFVVARFDRAGRADRAYGDKGRVETGLPAARATMLPDGGVVVAGLTGSQVDPQLTLLRYTHRGVRDTRFGIGGKAIAPLTPGLPNFRALGTEPDGDVLAAVGAAIYRFTPTGMLDEGFGSGGRVQLELSSTGSITVAGLAVQPDGRILLAGERRGQVDSGAQLLLARLMPDGALDTTFGGAGAGRILEDTADWRQAEAIALGRGGEILATGGSWMRSSPGFNRLALWRFSADGTGGNLSFAPAVTALESGIGVTVDRGGGIVLLGAGSAGVRPYTFLTRLRPDGRVDRGFGRDGRIVWADLGWGAVGPLLLPNGRIMVAMRRQLGKDDPDREEWTDVAVVRVLRLWGGYDRIAPIIRVRRSCAGGRTIARLRIDDRSRVRTLRVWLDGRRIRSGSGSRAGLALRHGGLLRIVAVDQAGNRAKRTVRILGCSRGG